MTALMERFSGLGAVLLVLGYIASAPLGMIYWGAKGWLLGVVLSFILPWFGGVSVLVQILC